MIAVVAMGAYIALYFLMLGAVGMVIEIGMALREGWSDEGESD